MQLKIFLKYHGSDNKLYYILIMEYCKAMKKGLEGHDMLS